jgi:hypothetical protein
MINNIMQEIIKFINKCNQLLINKINGVFIISLKLLFLINFDNH